VTCPHLRVVATSRELLRLSLEYDLPVPPLPLPPISLDSPAKLAENDAVRLFVTRATEVRPSFALTDEIAPVVAEICRRLDGLPLALELAAARIRLLPPKALLARLDRRLPMLTDGPRDLPVRQRTLRDTIGWSYGLLSNEEARVFRAIGVFVGGCTLDALEAVADVDQDALASSGAQLAAEAPPDIFDIVSSLVDKSLVRQTVSGDEPRFSLLETIREFALEQLEATGELARLRERHSVYFLELAQEADPFLISADQVRWLDRLEVEQGNLTAALVFARHPHTARPDDVGGSHPACELTGLRMAGSLHWFWWLGGHVGEGRRWLREFMACETGLADLAVRVRALYAAGTLAMIQGDYDEAETLLKSGEQNAEALGDIETHGLCLTYRGILEAYAHESGLLDRITPIRTAERAYRLLERTGNLWGQALALSQLGAHSRRAGEFEASEQQLRRAVAIARTVGERYLIGSCLPKLGTLYMDVGDYGAAEPLYRDALAAFRELREAWWTGRCLHYLALAAGGRGDVHRAALLIGSSDEQLEQSGARRNPAERRKYEGLIATLRERLGEADFEDVYSRGRLTALDAMMSHILEDPQPVRSH
jgi:predicted ATPase